LPSGAGAAAVMALDADAYARLPEIERLAVCLSPSREARVEAAGMTTEPDETVRLIEPVQVATDAASVQAVVGQWHLGRVEAPAAHARSRGSGATIAVLDTGVDCTHAGLAGRCIAGRDYIGGRPQGPGLQGDGHGHGTHVSGIAAETIEAVTDGGTGLAPEASIWPMRVLDDGGFGQLSGIARAIIDASKPGVAINMSLGGPGGSDTLRDAVALAGASGAVVVVARGNDGDTQLDYPVCYEPSIGVAATNSGDRRTSWSSWGQCTDVAAPGDAIVAPRVGGGYVAMSGTSMSSPVVAGIAALLIGQGAAPRDVPGMIAAAMDAVSDATIPGRVNARRAVAAPPPTAGPSPTPGPVITSPPYPGTNTPPTPTQAAATARPTVTRAPTRTATRVPCEPDCVRWSWRLGDYYCAPCGGR